MMFGLPNAELREGIVAAASTLERFFSPSPRGPSNEQSNMSRPSLNDAVSSVCGMSVASLDDDRGLSDIEVDAGTAAPQYTTLQTRDGVSATPNTARALGVASAVAARSMAEPQNSSKQGDATSADVVKAVIQGKLDGVINGVLGGEPVSEKTTASSFSSCSKPRPSALRSPLRASIKHIKAKLPSP